MVNPRCNALMRQLPESDYQLILPHLHLVSLLAGQTIYSPGDRIEHVRLPISTQIALSRDLGDGTRIDVALVGASGMVGMRGLFGGRCEHGVHVAVSGLAYQISVPEMLAALHRSISLHQMCLRAYDRVIQTVSDEMACSHFHCIKQRLARWVLSRQDQLGSDLIEVTHQGIADALGVRREAISNTFTRLQGIRLGRGYIELLDRGMLEAHACRCYFEQQKKQPQQLLLPLHD